MPTYRMYLDAGLTEWIEFTTPTNAAEVPEINLDSATRFTSGTYTDDELNALQMYQAIAVLPDGIRPLVTDYGKWVRTMIRWDPSIDYSIAVTGGGTALGSYTCMRPRNVATTIAATLGVLGVPNAVSADGQCVYYRNDPATVWTSAQEITCTMPAGWSGPVLFP